MTAPFIVSRTSSPCSGDRTARRRFLATVVVASALAVLGQAAVARATATTDLCSGNPCNVTATVSIAGSASTAIFARILFTPQITAIETSWIKSSGAKAREGCDTQRS